MAAEVAAGRGMCPRCHASAPRVYGLPEKVLKSQASPRSACYFCFVRIVGIKPTRSRLIAWPDLATAPAWPRNRRGGYANLHRLPERTKGRAADSGLSPLSRPAQSDAVGLKHRVPAMRRQ